MKNSPCGTKQNVPNNTLIGKKCKIPEGLAAMPEYLQTAPRAEVWIKRNK